MLNDFHNQVKIESQRDDSETTSSSTLHMSSTLNSELDSSSSQTDASLNCSSQTSSSFVAGQPASLSLFSGSRYAKANTTHAQSISLTNGQQHQHQQDQLQLYHEQHQASFNAHQLHNQLMQHQATVGGSYSANGNQHLAASYNNCSIKQEPDHSQVSNGNGSGLASGCNSSSEHKAPFAAGLAKPLPSMNVEASQLIGLAPLAHGSDHLQSNMHYSLGASKNLANSSPSGLALNFSSHDLLQSGHHSNQSMQHHSGELSVDSNNSVASKHQPSSSASNAFELDSGSLMPGMWKNTMSLSHFKHSNMADHGFLPSSDMNATTFSWAHGANMGHQTAQMTHHILDNQHLIGAYPHQHHHHQRSLALPNQSELVGGTLKGQSNADQAATSFMLNSINHQASTSNTHIPQTSHHHTTPQPHELLNIRSQQLDHGATYNLAEANQFYGASRSENRSHTSGHMKPTSVQLITDTKPMQLSLGNHQANSLHHYHHATTNNDHNSPQATTSQHSQGLVAGHQSSRNIGSFRCQHCDQVFSMRNVYQSHLKTHSRERGAKAKFQCELCGHSFSQKTSLNRHMKSHTGERPFPCEVCGKAFSEKERLKIHMRTHTGEKPFSCGICGKSFSQKSTVKRHQTVHTGEKKFKCDCGKGFANRGNLIAHIKTRGSSHFE